MASERQEAVVQTLRYVAGVVFAQDEAQAKWIYDLATEVEQSTPSDWWSCPVCEEATCDDGCPLEPLRRDPQDALDGEQQHG